MSARGDPRAAWAASADDAPPCGSLRSARVKKGWVYFFRGVKKPGRFRAWKETRFELAEFERDVAVCEDLLFEPEAALLRDEHARDAARALAAAHGEHLGPGAVVRDQSRARAELGHRFHPLVELARRRAVRLESTGGEEFER